MSDALDPTADSFYDAVGGHEMFTALIRDFYASVAVDPVLRPIYPEADLGPAEERFRMFLEQYWGGPTTYSQQRGHPRLRMRHNPFRITSVERDAWLVAMRGALDNRELPSELDEAMWRYFMMAAQSMVNTEDDVPDLGASR